MVMPSFKMSQNVLQKDCFAIFHNEKIIIKVIMRAHIVSVNVYYIYIFVSVNMYYTSKQLLVLL